MVNEHEFEPLPGLPAPLPEGETILWQGSPDWRPMALRTMRVNQAGIYFAVLIVWGIVFGAADGTPAADLALSSLRLAVLGLAAAGILTLLGWLAARTTLYTITSRRVVLRIGIAFPIAIQVPFSRIESAGLKSARDGSGDIALRLLPGERIAYLVLWPHARPWTFARAEPSFRAVPDAAGVARVLGRALSASASQPAAVMVPMAEPDTGAMAQAALGRAA